MENELSNAIALYTEQFNQLLQLFLSWGQWLFFGLLTFHLAWKWLWAAFAGQSLADAFPPFLKELFIIGFFYSLMLHTDWIFQLLPTLATMGKQVMQVSTDPSHLIGTGIAIGNRMIASIAHTGLLHMTFSAILVLVAYLFVVYVFLKIAVEVAVTLIVTTALINLSAFLLGFSAFSTTRRIAQQTLEVILGNGIKLLGFYVVIGVSQHAFDAILKTIPSQLQTFDPYIWLCATVMLFYLLAENLPQQMARIVSGFLHENRGTSPMAIASTLSQVVTPVLSKVGITAVKTAQLASASTLHAAAQFKHQASGGNPLKNLATAAHQTLGTVAKGMGGQVKDHWKDLATRMAGGTVKTPPEGLNQRLHNATQGLRENSQTSEGVLKDT